MSSSSLATIDRRAFLCGLTLVTLAAPRAVEAQQTERVARIGRLSPTSAAADVRVGEAFEQGLHDLGWIDGRNVTTERRFADGNPRRLSELAAELVRLKVDVIVAGSTPAIVAARNATATIPIVMVTTGDPVASGLVKSLARPGGNITGLTALGQALNAKRLELLKEAVPGATRFAVLGNPTFPDTTPAVKGVHTAAQALGVQLRVVEVRDPGELDKAFAAMRSDRVKGLMVLADPMFNAHRRQIVELAGKSLLPAMYGLREFSDAGGLMFYGAGLPDMWRRAAYFVDKILKGAKPADLPVEQPTKFELVINLKTAKELGLTIPQSILLRADQVIE